MADKIILKTLDQTCGACPSQWEGFTEDGREVYIRYRWGCLTAEWWQEEWTPDQVYLYDRQVGGPYDGRMDTETMLRYLSEIISYEPEESVGGSNPFQGVIEGQDG